VVEIAYVYATLRDETPMVYGCVQTAASKIEEQADEAVLETQVDVAVR
jgi:hypothetical protein